MLFEDKDGQVLSSDDVDALSPFEIEERGIHLHSSGKRGGRRLAGYLEMDSFDV